MNFRNPADKLSAQEVEQIEDELGLQLPHPVRSLYLKTNGGYPEKPVFEIEEVETIVAQLLPLTAEKRVNAFRSYRLLVEQREIVPSHLFPFAVDAGGDYFFVDTRSQEGRVLFFRADEDPGEQLLDLNLDFDAFWQHLELED